MKKIMSIVLLSALFIMTFSGCGEYKTVEETPVVLKVDGQEFHAGEVAEYMKQYKAECENTYSSMIGTLGGSSSSANSSELWDSEDMQDDLRATAVDRLLKDLAITQYMDENNLELSESDQAVINNKKASMIFNYGSIDNLNKYLETIGCTESSYDKKLKMTQSQQVILNYCYGANGKMRPSDQEITDYYNSYYYNIQVISLMKTTSDDPTVTKLDVANEILAKAKSGEDFDSLFDQYSESDVKNVVLCYSSNLEKPLIDAAVLLDENEVSDTIVDGTYCYYVIKRIPLDKDALFAPDGLYDGTSIADDVAKKLGSIDDILDPIIDSYKVEQLDAIKKLTPKNLDKYIIVTDTTNNETAQTDNGTDSTNNETAQTDNGTDSTATTSK